MKKKKIGYGALRLAVQRAKKEYEKSRRYIVVRLNCHGNSAESKIFATKVQAMQYLNEVIIHYSDLACSFAMFIEKI